MNRNRARRDVWQKTNAIALVVVVVMLFTASSACAQTDAQQKAQARQNEAAAEQAQDASDETPAARVARCWQLILDSLHDTKNGDRQAQAMNALSEMPNNARATGLIAEGMKDPNMDVRTAAILAAGKTKAPALVRPLRRLLDDPEPQVVFAAATTLWIDFKDRSGEDILDAVADGDRKANPSLMHGAQHDMSRTMHSPSTLAKIGITTGAGLLLGPFGFAVSGVEYWRKNGADSARVEALNLLSEDKDPAVHGELVAALSDKDPGVRAAAAHQLGAYRSRANAAAIAPLVDDSRLPVRLSAAAAYINSMAGSAYAARSSKAKKR
jgi:HEAT repeat protein